MGAEGSNTGSAIRQQNRGPPVAWLHCDL